MPRWRVLQYEEVFESFYASCPQDTQGVIDHRLDLLMELGNQAREPISKPLEDGIFELRAKQARLFFYFGVERTIVIVHAIFKARSGVPRNDIRIAKRRRVDLEEGSATTQ